MEYQIQRFQQQKSTNKQTHVLKFLTFHHFSIHLLAQVPFFELKTLHLFCPFPAQARKKKSMVFLLEDPLDSSQGLKAIKKSFCKHLVDYNVYIYIYVCPVKVSNFSPQVCFWWFRGSNFRPVEDSGIRWYKLLNIFSF